MPGIGSEAATKLGLLSRTLDQDQAFED